MLRLGVLASTNGTDMQPIIEAIASGGLEASIVVVISNKQQCGAFDRAKEYGLPCVWVDPKQFGTREAFDEAVASILEQHQVDLVLMIGYMPVSYTHLTLPTNREV